MAVALGLGFTAPNASAIIEVESGGAGDALQFPLYIAKSGWENYYAITNNSGDWIQGHLRFRGGAWCAEMRDFDVILSPGDVFVFRVADIDGDGYGELDMSLDPYNFMYTGMLEANNQWFDPADGDQLRPYGNLTQGENTLTSRCRAGVDGAYMTSSDFTGRQYYPCMDLDTSSLVDESIKTYYSGGIEAFDARHPGRRDHQKTIGYVEFIGEGILEGMSHAIMQSLLASAKPANTDVSYPDSRPRLHDGVTEHKNVNLDAHQTDVFSGRGTNLWQWTNADGGFATDVDVDGNGTIDVIESTALFADDLGARDMPNVLTGTGFVSVTGGHAAAYNAEAYINFRTAGENRHRIENYRTVARSAGDTLGRPIDDFNGDGVVADIVTPVQLNADRNPALAAVIIHHEDGASSSSATVPAGNYVYSDADNDSYEKSISFNNTWGPTLADGDDYDLSTLRPGSVVVPFGFVDDFDRHALSAAFYTSVAEVDEAIRLAGQTFYGYYFDSSSQGSGVLKPKGDKTLSQTSWYFAWYPTKYYYGERESGFTMADFFGDTVDGLLTCGKSYGVEVWDINENPGTPVSVAANACPSPFIPSLYATLYPQCVGQDAPPQVLGLSEELAVFSIDALKSTYGLDSTASIYSDQYAAGRMVLSVLDDNPMNDNLSDPYCGTGDLNVPKRTSFPGLMYTIEFEDNGDGLYHWRALQRNGSRAGNCVLCK